MGADISRAGYWDHPGISQSQIKDAARSLRHYYSRHVLGQGPRRDTRAMRMGRALHALVLEADTFEARFPVFVGELRTADAKARFAELDARAEALDGCAIRDIKGDWAEVDALTGMRDALMSDARFRLIFEQITAAELPIAWTCDATGLLCKARLDALTPTVALDIKTCEDASPQAIKRSVATYGYHIQAAHYLAAAKAFDGRERAFVLAFVEKSPPYAVNVCAISPALVARADEKRIDLLEKIRDARKIGAWPAYDGDIWEIDDLPPWAA